MKLIKKIINLIIVVILMTMSINIFSYETYGADTVDSVIQGAQDFLNKGQDTVIDETRLHNASNFIFNLLLAVAMIVAVIVGMVLGIQFMTSSIEEKAKIKEALLPYVVSCIVIFGAFGIWKLAVIILSKW